MNLSQLQYRLIKITESPDFHNLEPFCAEFENARLVDFDKFVKFSTESYTSNTLCRTEKFEIRLLCWKPFQETPRHLHPENGCLMKILKGRLIEEKFVDKGTVRTVYQEGEVGYIVSRESHILKNPQMDSVSLHIYAPSGFYDLV